jgi:hypothetical protein
MDRPQLEVADIFRCYGTDYRLHNGASMSRGQHRVMTAIEVCRTARDTSRRPVAQMGVNNRNRDKGARLGADHAALPIVRKIASSHITAKAAPLDRCRCFFARADAVYAFRTQGFSSMESALSYRQGEHRTVQK